MSKRYPTILTATTKTCANTSTALVPFHCSTSSSASLAIVLLDSSETRLMLLRLLIVDVREPARFRFAPPEPPLGNPFEPGGGDPGELGRTSDWR